MWLCRRCWCVATLVFGLAGAGANAATVTYVEQQRTIRVEAEGHFDDADSAAGGRFQATAEASNDRPQLRSQAHLSVDSDLDDAGLRFSGTRRFSQEVLTDDAVADPGSSGLGLTFETDVIFRVHERHRYEFSFGQIPGAPSTGTALGGSEYFLYDESQADVFRFEGENSATGSKSGVLEPGIYVFHADFVDQNVGKGELVHEDDEYQSSYAITLALSDPGTAGGNDNANPIPLPPAVWSGLATMGAVLLVGWLRRRRA